MQEQWEHCERLKQKAVEEACEELTRKLRNEFALEREKAVGDALAKARVISSLLYDFVKWVFVKICYCHSRKDFAFVSRLQSSEHVTSARKSFHVKKPKCRKNTNRLLLI